MRTLLRIIGRCDFLRLGIRLRIIRKFSPPVKGRFCVPFYGLTFCGDFEKHIDWWVYFFGAYGKSELYLLKRFAKRDGTCLDIGANVGNHTLFLSQYYGTVHSFEPYPEVLAILKEQLQRNHVRNVTVHAVGLGDADAEVPFYAPASRHQGIGSFVKGYSGGEKYGTKEHGTLPVRQGDRYLKAHGIDSVDVIKIDIEGYEKAALSGLHETLKTSRPVVLMEFTKDTGNSFKDAQEFRALFPDNYAFYNVVSDEPFLVLFNRRIRLEPFDFDKPLRMVLCAPAEKRVPR